MTVIVFGLMGCGKTHNAEALRKHFKCSKVVDTWDGFSRLPRNALALTCFPIVKTRGAKVVEFDEACRQAGIPPRRARRARA